MISFTPVPARSIWYSAWTAASRAAPRLLALRASWAFRSASALDILAFPEALLEADQCQRGAHCAAAFVLIVDAGARLGLGLVLDGDDAVADRNSAGDGQIQKPARGFMRDDFKMDCFAANDAAERHRAIIGPTLLLRRIERNRNRCWDFERARHADAVE